MKSELILEVNGESREFTEGEFPPTVAALIAIMGLDAEMVIAEVNGDIVKRARLAEHPLEPGDQVELVKLVGGG